MNTFELRLNPVPFQQFEQGKKTVEMRLYDEKRRMFKVGDILIFKNRENETASAADMEEYYSKAEQANYGVVGIEIKVLN